MITQEKTRVLIADDDPAVLKLLERHLVTAGYEVLTASDGSEALRIMLTEGPRIVVIDWEMPEMTGVEFCRAVRDFDAISFAYIIIITAHQTDESSIVEAFESGADDYLAKPIRQKELIARIRAGERIVTLQRAMELRNREAYRFNAQAELTNEKLAYANDQLTVTATTDDLTELINRRAAMERLAEQWALAERNFHPLSCILFDVDLFKRFNDAHGHEVGDVVLRELARITKETMRSNEIVCRIGGEEFLIICPCTSADQAMTAAERLRSAVESSLIVTNGLELHATISIGVAERDPDMERPDELLRAADEAMYAVKRAGRNAVARAGSYVEGSNVATARFESAQSDLHTADISLAQPDGRSMARVLVVDDDDDIRTLSRRSLERDGFEVFEANDGAAGIEIAVRELPDVIIMDAIMPGMDGLKSTRILKNRSETKHIPIIIASARTDTTDIIAGLEAGADEYVTKPVTRSELIMRVRTVLRLRHELRCNNEIRGEQSRTLALLSDFAREITAAPSLSDVLMCTVTTTASLTGSRRITLLLPDDQHEQLTITEPLSNHAENDTRTIPIAETALGSVFTTADSIHVETEQDAQRYKDGEDSELLATAPSFAIPLCAPHGVVGVLCMTGRTSKEALTPFHTECVHLIGNIAGSAIDERNTRRSRDEARHAIVVALAKLAEYRDDDTGRHLERVTRFCLILAKKLAESSQYQDVIDEDFLHDLEHSAPLHDIGKVAIPDRILLKPGALTPDEFVIMRTHAAIGAKTIQSLLAQTPNVSFLVMAEEIARCHHEWFDGNGYPSGISGTSIPLCARIAAVADVYDAVTTKRVYKAAMTHQAAVDIITGSIGRQFDLHVVAAFRACEAEIAELASTLADDPGATSGDAPSTLAPRERIPAMSRES